MTGHSLFVSSRGWGQISLLRPWRRGFFSGLKGVLSVVFDIKCPLLLFLLPLLLLSLFLFHLYYVKTCQMKMKKKRVAPILKENREVLTARVCLLPGKNTTWMWFFFSNGMRWEEEEKGNREQHSDRLGWCTLDLSLNSSIRSQVHNWPGSWHRCVIRLMEFWTRINCVQGPGTQGPPEGRIRSSNNPVMCPFTIDRTLSIEWQMCSGKCWFLGSIWKEKPTHLVHKSYPLTWHIFWPS